MVPVSSRRRSLRVDLPWSTCATMQKLRNRSIGIAAMRFSSSDCIFRGCAASRLGVARKLRLAIGAEQRRKALLKLAGSLSNREASCRIRRHGSIRSLKSADAFGVVSPKSLRRSYRHGRIFARRVYREHAPLLLLWNFTYPYISSDTTFSFPPPQKILSLANLTLELHWGRRLVSFLPSATFNCYRRPSLPRRRRM